jgi:putative aldouronate transport system permease protein
MPPITRQRRKGVDLKTSERASSPAAGRLTRIKKFMPFYILFVPVAVYYLLFCYAPMAGVIIAFKDYSFRAGIFGSPWVGLKHFVEAVKDDVFWQVFENTLVISGLRILFGFPAPIVFALMINELRREKFKRFIQTVSYLPHFISWVVIYGILFSFFSSSGLVNQIIENLGGTGIRFLSSQEYFRQFFVGAAIWKELGWSSIIYLAALSSIDAGLYEASMIDGANRWQQLTRITFPSIRGVVSVMLVLNLTNVLSVGFDQVLVMINPTVSGIAETIDYYVYRIGIMQSNNYSYATAIGLFKSVLSLALVLTANWAARKIDPEEGGLW